MSGLVKKTNEHGQVQEWWTIDEIDAALCLWEYSQHCRETSDDSVHDWLRGGEGACAARHQCIELAKDCERSYRIANELGYDTSFDWEFVPRWMREAMHITTYSLLTPAWIDYIGRRIYDEFRLEHERVSR